MVDIDKKNPILEEMIDIIEKFHVIEMSKEKEKDKKKEIEKERGKEKETEKRNEIEREGIETKTEKEIE